MGRFVLYVKFFFVFGMTVVSGGVPMLAYGQDHSSASEPEDPFAEEEFVSPVLQDPLPSQYMLAPLGAYADPFVSLSEFGFSFLRYRPRGYDFRQQTVSVNGIDLGDEFTGNPYWGLLRLVYDTPYEAVREEGLSGTFSSPGRLGGVRDYAVEAGLHPVGGRVGLIYTDRRFRGGARLNVNSGWSSHGWAGSVTASRRWGRDAHVKGVFADDWSVLAAVDKRWGEKHTLSLSAWMASTQQGLRGATTAEAFDLSGDMLYNPYWGDQAGKPRNARVRDNAYAMGLLSWRFQPSERWQVKASAALLQTKTAYSGFDRYSASNPYPDYYRYMPSHIDNPEVAETVREAWLHGDARVTQIDWNYLYEINDAAQDGRAVYVLGSDCSDQLGFQLTASFEHRSPLGFRVSGGFRTRIERDSRYRRLDDLLGASYWLDIDPYLIDDEYFGDQLQNDLNHPDRQVGPGDTYGYNYDLYHRYYGGWVGLETNGPSGGFGDTRLKGRVTFQTAWRSYDRQGYYEKELFSGSASYGLSPQAIFTEYLLKGTLSYAFSPAHHLSLEVAYGDQAPVARNIFLSADYQNRLVDPLRCENLLSGELRYRWSRRWFEMSLSAYATWFRGGTQVRGYYDDISGEYANAIMSDIDRMHLGIEWGLLFTLTPRWSLRVAGALTQQQYTRDACLDIYADKSGEPLAEDLRAVIQGYHLGGTPQRVIGGELRYSGRLWMASLALNWAGDHYVMLNPLRRTRRVCDLVSTPEIRDAFLDQERLNDATTLDLFVSKSFRIRNDYLSLSASVRNLTNRRSMVYSAYEPWRIARSGSGVNRTYTPFDTRYLHAYGRTFYLTLNYRF